MIQDITKHSDRIQVHNNVQHRLLCHVNPFSGHPDLRPAELLAPRTGDPLGLSHRAYGYDDQCEAGLCASGLSRSL